MFKYYMNNKGFADNQISIETPNDVMVAEKPLKDRQKRPERVDINVLKSKLQETESKEFKKKFIYSFNSNFSIRCFRNLSIYKKICKKINFVIKYEL